MKQEGKYRAMNLVNEIQFIKWKSPTKKQNNNKDTIVFIFYTIVENKTKSLPDKHIFDWPIH